MDEATTQQQTTEPTPTAGFEGGAAPLPLPHTHYKPPRSIPWRRIEVAAIVALVVGLGWGTYAGGQTNNTLRGVRESLASSQREVVGLNSQLSRSQDQLSSTQDRLDVAEADTVTVGRCLRGTARALHTTIGGYSKGIFTQIYTLRRAMNQFGAVTGACEATDGIVDWRPGS